MSAFADLVRFLPVAGGTTDWVVSSAVGGCQLPSAANVQNGVSYKLYAVSTDLTQWEVIISVYNSGTTTFPRTTVLYNSSGTGTATGQSGAGTKINFSTIPQVSVVALAEDLQALFPWNYLTGLTLSTAGSSTTFTIAPGACADSTNVQIMQRSTSLSKSTSSWAVGNTAGGLDTGTIAGSTWYHAYLIQRLDTGVVDAVVSQAPNLTSTATATSASPAVFTWGADPALPFVNGTPVTLSGGTAPIGFTLGTQYYVVAASGATFELSATQGGSAINSSSTGSGFSVVAAPVLPANYTFARYIGSIKTNGSSQWQLFFQNGDTFLWSDMPSLDYNATAPGTSAVTVAVTTPPGVRCEAVMNINLGLAAGALNDAWLLSSLDIADTAPSNTASPLSTLGTNPTGASTVAVQARCWTNRSSSIRSRLASSAAGTTAQIQTIGYVDTRGKV